MANTTIIAGVDLSQTGLGLVAFGEDYDLDWSNIEFQSFGLKLNKNSPPWERIGRLYVVCEAAVEWIKSQDVTHVWIEGYPSSGRVFNLDKEAEIGGALRYALRRDLELCAFTAPLSTARKLIMGKLPRADVKAIVHNVVRSFGVPDEWTGDVIDAWVAANYGLGQMGGKTVAAKPVETPKRPRKSRRRAA